MTTSVTYPYERLSSMPDAEVSGIWWALQNMLKRSCCLKHDQYRSGEPTEADWDWAQNVQAEMERRSLPTKADNSGGVQCEKCQGVMELVKNPGPARSYEEDSAFVCRGCQLLYPTPNHWDCSPPAVDLPAGW